jgi:hypothetical protein
VNRRTEEEEMMNAEGIERSKQPKQQTPNPKQKFL